MTHGPISIRTKKLRRCAEALCETVSRPSANRTRYKFGTSHSDGSIYIDNNRKRIKITAAGPMPYELCMLLFGRRNGLDSNYHPIWEFK